MDIHFTDQLPARNTYLRLMKRAVCDSTDRHSRINCMNSFMEVKVVLTFFLAPSAAAWSSTVGSVQAPTALLHYWVPRGTGSGTL